MTNNTSQTARKRIRQLALEPATADFVMNYLLSALDERAWPLLVQAALEYRDNPDTYSEDQNDILEVLRRERFF